MYILHVCNFGITFCTEYVFIILCSNRNKIVMKVCRIVILEIVDFHKIIIKYLAENISI